MSTEYRRGIPSVAHVEAATRLGLLWQSEINRVWILRFNRGRIVGDWSEIDSLSDIAHITWPRSLERLDSHAEQHRPIRTDGTPVDWEVLDAEVARAVQPVDWHSEYPALAQRAQRLGWNGGGSLWGLCAWARVSSEGCAGPNREQGIAAAVARIRAHIEERERPATTVTSTTPAAPTTQLQGFRADLWRRICEHFLSERSNDFNLLDIVSLRETSIDLRDPQEYGGQWLTQRPCSADIITRWAVYQELKPLYDIVDGAQGEVTMPRDVVTEWARQARGGENIRPDWELVRTPEGLLGRTTDRQGGIVSWSDSENWLGQPLRNFAAVLDAVAVRRVAVRQAGQTLRQQLAELPQAVQAERAADEARRLQMEARLQSGPPAQLAQPEPRRFADVRPDRHGWRWWLVRHALPLHQTWLRIDHNRPYDWSTVETVIPTDEQGNPVSWESIGLGRGMPAEEARRIENAVAASVQEQMTRPINWRAASLTDATRHFQQLQEFTSRAITQAVIGPISFNNHVESGYTVRNSDGTGLHDSLKQQPLPRFTADELDDVDHSATTTLDNGTLKRGKLPTVEAIGKYREVMTKRNGTVAEAVKASGIDCEVAQYVLERWAGGLNDTDVRSLLGAVGCMTPLEGAIPSQLRVFDPTKNRVDELAQHWLKSRRPTLDISEPADTAAQRQRAEAAERKTRMTALQAQLAKERAARVMEPEPELSRFALLEVDEAADPARSIEAWKAQRARNVVRPIAVPASQPTPAPRRKAFEVVDAQAEGLSGGAAFAVLLSRAMNQNC